ncbi:MAG: non-heme iron oxygenase ferredoxin subunit [Gammaproteobacteria bacterium]|nr:non-heme iron oxygenase ferredoxin subunit [Gammaproteobacteria bacterium]
MSEQIKVAHLDEIPNGKMFRAIVNSTAILIANIENNLYAIDDMCTHEDASLYKGALKGHCVECPLHGSHFDFRTGKPDGNPATQAVKRYDIKVIENEIFITLP